MGRGGKAFVLHSSSSLNITAGRLNSIPYLASYYSHNISSGIMRMLISIFIGCCPEMSNVLACHVAFAKIAKSISIIKTAEPDFQSRLGSRDCQFKQASVISGVTTRSWRVAIGLQLQVMGMSL